MTPFIQSLTEKCFLCHSNLSDFSVSKYCFECWNDRTNLSAHFYNKDGLVILTSTEYNWFINLDFKYKEILIKDLMYKNIIEFDSDFNYQSYDDLIKIIKTHLAFQ